jgi:APA family basic amino acid/polyamine antiporter
MWPLRFQSMIALVLVLTSSFEALITYVSFTLNLFTFLTVFGIFILRRKFAHIKTTYKTPLYPITPIVFLSILLWIIINIIREKPTESLYGLFTVCAGLVIYYLTNRKAEGNQTLNDHPST